MKAPQGMRRIRRPAAHSKWHESNKPQSERRGFFDRHRLQVLNRRFTRSVRVAISSNLPYMPQSSNALSEPGFPLTGSKTWVDMDGVSVVKKVWDGRANLAEYKADGPSGHIELMALRWFNPTTHEWNIDFATPNVGMLGAVPGVGEFKNGRGDFYDYEPINGKSVLVRFSISSITPDTAQSEQAFSEDGGKDLGGELDQQICAGQGRVREL